MKYLKIYMIEDDDDHFELANFSINKSEHAEILYRSSDGEEALSLVNQIIADEIEKPDLVMLDINIPKIDGIEVLKKFKGCTELATIPVVIFTTSNASRDKARAYENHANSYMVKPADFDEMKRILDLMIEYWGNCNRL